MILATILAGPCQDEDGKENEILTVGSMPRAAADNSKMEMTDQKRSRGNTAIS